VKKQITSIETKITLLPDTLTHPPEAETLTKAASKKKQRKAKKSGLKLSKNFSCLSLEEQRKILSPFKQSEASYRQPKYKRQQDELEKKYSI